MAASGVGQFSINVKSNLKSFYGDLIKSKKTMDDLTARRHQLKIDSSQLDKLRDKSQRIAAEMRELRQQKTEIKLGMKGTETISRIKKELSGVNAGIENINKKKLQIQANPKSVNDADKLLKSLDSSMKTLQAKKIALQMDLKSVDTTKEQLKEIDKSIASLNRQKLEIDAEIQPIRTANVELYKVEKEIDALNKKRVRIDVSGVSSALSGSLSHLSDFSNQLSHISFAKLIAGAVAAKGILQDMARLAKGLFDELESDINMEKVFRQNQNLLGIDTSQTDAVYKELDKYADKTIYNASEMLNTYNALFNSGTEDTMELVKGLGAIAATAADSKQAMSTLSLQFSQAMINGLQRTDLRYMAEATNGGLAVAFKQAGKDYEDFSRRLGEANEKTEPGVRTRLAKELEEVVRGAAKNDAMNQLAETPKTIAQGLETVTASLVNITRKGFAPLQEVGIDWLTKISKDIEGIDKEKFVEFGENLADFADEQLGKLYNFLKNTDFKKLWENFSGGFMDSFNDLKEHLGMYKDLFGAIFGIDTKNVDMYEMAENIGKVIPKLLEYGIKFKEASLLFKAGAFGFQALSALSKLKIPGGGLLSNLFGKGSGGASAASNGSNLNMFKTLAKGIGLVAGVAGTILVAAKALQEVASVGDLSDLQPKLLVIAEAIIGMGLIATATGKLDQFSGGSMKNGLLNVALIGADIFIAAKALQEVGSIDSDFGSIQSKIGQIALSVTEIGVLATAIGAVMATGAGAFLTVGLLSIAAIAGTLFLTAKALQGIQGTDLDNEKIKSNIGTIRTAIEDIGGLDFESDVFSKIGELINSLLELGIVATVTAIGNQLTELQAIEIDNDKVKEKLAAIKDSVSTISNFGFESSVFSKLGELINSFIETGIVGNIITIGNQLTTLQDIDLNEKKIDKTIKTIKKLIDSTTKGSFFDSVKNFFANGMKSDELAPAVTLFKELKKIGESLENIQVLQINEKSLTEKINIIKNAIESISSFATGDIVDNLTGLSQALDEIIDDLAKQYPPEFNKLGETLAKKLTDGFKAKLDLKKVLSDKIKVLSTDGADTVGKKIANSINRSLENNLTIGDTIREAIQAALDENYSTDVDVNVNVNNENEAIPVIVGSRTTTATAIRASGGLITQKQVRLEDSPEKPLLQNGEYVIPKKIVNALGVPFFDKLRSGQVSRTFAGLARSVSNTTSNVVNNVYNNTTNQNNMYLTGGQDLVLAANRRFRQA